MNKANSAKRGTLLISLDLELLWGFRDVSVLDRRAQRMKEAPQAALALLELFKKYDIHATWATVGLLHSAHPQHALSYANKLDPNSSLKTLRLLEELKQSDSERHALYFAPELLHEIKKTRGQEIASHSFCHFDALDRGHHPKGFEADLQVAREIAKAQGIHLGSYVFAFNRINSEYLSLLKHNGFNSYRGTEKSWAYRALKDPLLVPAQRLYRLVDAHLNLSGFHNYQLLQPRDGEPLNLPASRFLRPITSINRPFQRLRMRRIHQALENAARSNKIFHLWWHPHNFSENLEANLEMLTEVLRQFKKLEKSYQIRSMNMSELTREYLDLHSR
ncbi:MAG: polysaccharide deacetylase family protein [Polyangiaceae bacterium]|nr:polysaccharide deacetylase family protein [Polyangiaceae bacterium]